MITKIQKYQLVKKKKVIITTESITMISFRYLNLVFKKNFSSFFFTLIHFYLFFPLYVSPQRRSHPRGGRPKQCKRSKQRHQPAAADQARTLPAQSTPKELQHRISKTHHREQPAVRTTPHHITPHHITSHHITSHHITSHHHIASHHITITITTHQEHRKRVGVTLQGRQIMWSGSRH